jgi:hypothetical protein
VNSISISGVARPLAIIAIAAAASKRRNPDMIFWFGFCASFPQAHPQKRLLAHPPEKNGGLRFICPAQSAKKI